MTSNPAITNASISTALYDPSAQEQPDVTQRRASNPDRNIWVSASAGTGKTKVLTDRVLRLLLPGHDGRPATKPHKILCMTFTKAAAGEMKLRILKTLSQWSVCDDAQLEEMLHRLLGQPANAAQLISARSLFTSVIDHPGGMNIMTIHSFCTSVLQRFPMEAGLNGGFEMMAEGEEQNHLRRALNKVLAREKGTALLDRLAQNIDENTIMPLLQTIIAKRNLIEHCDDDAHTINADLGHDPTRDIEGDYMHALAQRKPELAQIIKGITAHGSDTNKGVYANLRHWLEGSAPLSFDQAITTYLTKDKTLRHSLCVKAVTKNMPELEAILADEAEMARHAWDLVARRNLATQSADFLSLARMILAQYQEQKEALSLLDYHDLIYKTAQLLQRGDDIMQWVMYKLDGGIDHIMVDEAQDTSWPQWQIIRALSEPFFDGSSDDLYRSFFAVGDDKQSIYRFQGADPEIFQTMRDAYQQDITTAQRPFDVVDMTISFRSVEAVLTLVNAMLDEDALRVAMTDTQRARLTHTAWRSGHAGHVEIWPLLGGQTKAQIDAWDVGDGALDMTINPQEALCNRIAAHLKDLLDRGEVLPSQNRALTPQDILILVKGRKTPIYHAMNRALMAHNIPVAGYDRIALQREIAVEDVKSAMRFALLPEDDLNLAALLKTPFIAMDEDSLRMLCFGREEASLWSRVKTHCPEAILAWLRGLISVASQSGPFSLIMHILHTSCPNHDIAGQSALTNRLGTPCLDGIGEFLNKASTAQFQHRQTSLIFLQNLAQDDNDIKREMEEDAGGVRIMTAHGAKGLQAPFVIMPDTVVTAKGAGLKNNNIFWPGEHEYNFPLHVPSQGKIPMVEEIKETLKDKEAQEYQRLLYVAVTRAEDRLLICGAHGRDKPTEHSWYLSLARAMQNAAAAPVTSVAFDGDISPHSPLQHALVINTAQIIAPQPNNTSKNQARACDENHPQWLYEPARQEAPDQRPLSPSKSDEDAQPVAVPSPLLQHQDHRFLRGNLTHALLQILPDLSPQDRGDAALNYIQKYGSDLSQTVQSSIIDEVITLMDAPHLRAVFGPDSRAEVPVTGFVNGRAVSGQIDRLVIGDEQIIIIDYKTNRPPPDVIEDVPEVYIKQMRAYRDLIQTIEADKVIRCFLLWTQNAHAMELTQL